MSAVGRNIPHDSARGHVTGESMYVDDIAPVRGELIVDFFWSPVAHGRIRSINLDAARNVAGVVALFTHRDLEHNLFGPIIEDELLLAEDEVTFIGQPIVVIAAENRDAIRMAKAAMAIDIEPLEPVFTIDDARRRGQFIGRQSRIARGDLDRGFAEADHILEGVWRNGGQDHFYLESQAAIAYPGEFDALTVHSSTQNPSEVQHVIAHLLGLPINKVVVVTKRMGGGFGGKECQATHPAAIAALVAHKTRRPARIAYNKDDDMAITGGRHPFQNEYKAGFRNDGTLTALKVDIYSDGGAFADLSTAVLGRAMTHADNAYFIPNVEINGIVCRTNFPPNTAFRGFGGPQGVATIENILEEIAVYLHRDPIEIRMRNCYGIDDRNITPYGQTVSNNTLPRLFSELREKSGYDARVRGVAELNASSPTHLRGIACTAVKFGISFNTKFLNQGNALVNVYLDGSVQVSTGATEMGQGVNTKIRQIVADELGIDVERVVVMITSTEKNNNTSATAASSAADLNGSAAADACRKIRARMAEVAAEYFARTAPHPEPPEPRGGWVAGAAEDGSCHPEPPEPRGGWVAGAAEDGSCHPEPPEPRGGWVAGAAEDGEGPPAQETTTPGTPAHESGGSLAALRPSGASPARDDSAAHIIFAGDHVFDDRNPDNRVPFPALVNMCYVERVSLGERGFYATKGLDWDVDKGCGTPFLYFTKGCAVSEVEIDRFTGAMRVLRSDLLMDIGKPINPGIDRGQITGAFIQGMGWLTNEELRYTPEGVLLTHSPTTYKIPNIQDVPEVFNVGWIDAENPLNIRSSKAVGEPPLLLAISVFMAVKNALSYVSGGEIPKIDAPATGEEILMRLTQYAHKSKQAEAVSA